MQNAYQQIADVSEVSYMFENNFLEYCIYTMRNKKDLDLSFRNGGSGIFTENKVWREGFSLLKKAEQDNLIMLLFLSAAEEKTGIIYVAKLTSIEISDEHKTTTYAFSNLAKIHNPKPLSSLKLKSANRSLSDNYIRPYVVCHTPNDISGWLKETDLPPIPATRKSGQEQIFFRGQNTGFSLLDFWQWSSSDLVNNTLRGVLAEYLVAIALGVGDGFRVPWQAYDLYFDGCKIEVKSACYLQAWTQREYSSINFDIKKTLEWNEISNKQADECKRQADIYVFCLLNHKIQDTLDPLKLEQWEFYILPTRVIDTELGDAKNIGLKRLKQLKPLHASFYDIKTCVEKLRSQYQV